MKYAPIVLVLGFLQSGSALASPSEQETTTPKSPAHALPDTEWFASPGPAPVMRRIEGNRAELGPFREYYRDVYKRQELSVDRDVSAKNGLYATEEVTND